MMEELRIARVAHSFDYGKCNCTARLIWTNKSSKCVIPRSDVSFGDLNDAPLNFRSQTPKTERFCPWIELPSASDKRIQIFKTWTLQRRSRRNFSIMNGPSSGGPTTSPNKSNIADGSHIEFRKILISLYCMKIFYKIWYTEHTQIQHHRTEMATWPKRNRKLIRITSSIERLEQTWVALSD